MIIMVIKHLTFMLLFWMLQIKYSVMLPGTHVWPHTGPTNCRLRLHLGLVIPKNVAIRVGREIKYVIYI